MSIRKHLLRIPISLALLSFCYSIDIYSQEPSAFDSFDRVKDYVDSFNANDLPPHGWTIKNKDAYAFLSENVPLLDCPDSNIEKTYYFRWWTFRKHLRQTEDGWVITEFDHELPYGGKHGAIVCPAGHHFYEGRWLSDPKYLKDLLTFYLNDPESKPRQFSFWIADSAKQFLSLHPDRAWEKQILPLLVDRYHEWEDHRLEGNQLYWQNDVWDGMEYTVGGMVLNGGVREFSTPMTRPTINSYMYGDAIALSELAHRHGKSDLAIKFEESAATLQTEVVNRLWNEELGFFTPMPKRYDAETKPIAVRELIGFVPWYFNLPPDQATFSESWSQLMDKDGFFAPFGPTTCEQRHPGFKIDYAETIKPNCQWCGPSWPFATTQTLVAFANLLNDYNQGVVDKSDYFQILNIYANSHRFRQIKPEIRELDAFRNQIPTVIDEDRMWIDENLDPYTGNWLARYRFLMRGWGKKNRAKDYNHSGFCDLVISGLLGVRPELDGSLVINPLVPDSWDHFCLDNVHCQGKIITVIWDRDGNHYKGRKAGFTILVDGKTRHHSNEIEKVTLDID